MPEVAAAHHPFRGVLLFSCALFLFACMDTTTKYLVAYYEVPLVVAIRYIVQCLLMIVLLAPTQGRRLIQTQRTGLVWVRAACLAVASLCVGMAFQRMPVAETTAILFLSPMLVVLIAGPLLRERVSMVDWIAASTGMLGIVLIARPGGDLDPVGIVYALGAVGLLASYQLLSRVLIRTERTVALIFYMALVGSILFGIGLPWYWSGAAPSTMQILLFLSLGVTGGLGHFLFTTAHRHAPASLLAPTMYVQLVWAGVLGWLVFDHVPDRLSVLGMGVVAAGGVLVALNSRRTRVVTPADALGQEV